MFLTKQITYRSSAPPLRIPYLYIKRGQPHRHNSKYKKGTDGNKTNRTKENMQDEKQARTKRYGGAHAEYRAQHSDTVHYPAPFGRLRSGLSRPSARMAQIARDLEGCR